MAINKKLIHFKTKSNFEKELANKNILDSSICFIKETKEIWTHGQLYNCSELDTSELRGIVDDLSNTKADKSDIPTKVSDLENDSNFVTTTQVDNKQDIIQDLETIRDNAKKGSTALQSFTEEDPIFKASPVYNITSNDISNWNSKTSNIGTVTSVKINGQSKSPSDGIVDLGTVITTHQPLKTINGESIVGSGDITVSGGSSDANVQAVDTQETIDSVDGFKTINGQSIIGNGNIEISASSSGGGSGVYITPFTVEQFITGTVELSDELCNELIDAASKNRIIGIPIQDSDAGFVLTSYKYSFNTDPYDWGLYLSVIYNDIIYKNNMFYGGVHNFQASGLSITPLNHVICEVEVQDGKAYVYDPLRYPDKAIYYVYGECAELNICIETAGIDYIIKFFTGENCSLYFAYDVLWANGKLPTIEPYTEYELSLSASINGGFNAVLTKFKSVE